MLTTDFTHWASALYNQFVYILDGIEAANIFWELSNDHGFWITGIAADEIDI